MLLDFNFLDQIKVMARLLIKCDDEIDDFFSERDGARLMNMKKRLPSRSRMLGELLQHQQFLCRFTGM
jgi:hypothetical protein